MPPRESALVGAELLVLLSGNMRESLPTYWTVVELYVLHSDHLGAHSAEVVVTAVCLDAVLTERECLCDGCVSETVGSEFLD